MRLRQLRNSYLGWIFLLCVGAAIMFFVYLPNYTRLKNLKAENARLQEEITRLTSQIHQLSVDLKRLENDPYLWEELARQHIGVVKEGEIVIDIQRQGE